MAPPASSPIPPFRLSHLAIFFDNAALFHPAYDVGGIFNKLLEGSKTTLTTLKMSGVGYSPSAACNTLDIVARTPLPNLRNFISVYNGIRILELAKLLPLLPSLQSLELLNLSNQSDRPLLAYLSALPPSLLTLRLDWHNYYGLPPRGPAVKFDELRLSLARPAATNLRQLHLPAHFRAAIDDGAWGEFEDECERRNLRVYLI